MKLKPCPFCGGEAKTYRPLQTTLEEGCRAQDRVKTRMAHLHERGNYVERNFLLIYCSNPHCRVAPSIRTKLTELIENKRAWNTRVEK